MTDVRLHEVTSRLTNSSKACGASLLSTLPADDPDVRAADRAIELARQAHTDALAQRSALLEERASLSPRELLRESRRLATALQAFEQAIATASEQLTFATADRVAALTRASERQRQ